MTTRSGPRLHGLQEAREVEHLLYSRIDDRLTVFVTITRSRAASRIRAAVAPARDVAVHISRTSLRGAAAARVSTLITTEQ
jgi:hypothetical protein